jgi:hypothetical protein
VRDVGLEVQIIVGVDLLIDAGLVTALKESAVANQPIGEHHLLYAIVILDLAPLRVAENQESQVFETAELHHDLALAPLLVLLLIEDHCH